MRRANPVALEQILLKVGMYHEQYFVCINYTRTER